MGEADKLEGVHYHQCRWLTLKSCHELANGGARAYKSLLAIQRTQSHPKGYAPLKLALEALAGVPHPVCRMDEDIRAPRRVSDVVDALREQRLEMRA